MNLGLEFKNKSDIEVRNFDEKILDALREINRPISTVEISFLTNIDHRKVCQKLRILKKYGLVERKAVVNAKRINYWEISENGKGDK